MKSSSGSVGPGEAEAPTNGLRQHQRAVSDPLISAHLVQYFAARVERTPGGCLLWLGPSDKGRPVMTPRFLGKSLWYNARLYSWLAAGRDLTDDRAVTSTCGALRCVEPTHLVSEPWTSQGPAAGVYGEWCRDPNICAGRGYCPRDPNCGE